MAVGSAIIAGIGLTASAVSGKKQYDSQVEAQEAAEEQAAADLLEAQERDRALKLQTAQDAEQAKGNVDFGVDSGDTGTYNDFSTPTASVSSRGSSGLGFS